MTKRKRIIVHCSDGEGRLEALLQYIKTLSGYGHSFDIVVDPDDREMRKKFYIDGDGADKIRQIEVSDD